jgi:hypothetical protein
MILFAPVVVNTGTPVSDSGSGYIETEEWLFISGRLMALVGIYKRSMPTR